MGLGLTHLSRIPARLALGFRMDLAFVLRSPALTIYYLAIDALLIPAVGGATFLLAERLAGIGPWSDWQVLFLLGYATTCLLYTSPSPRDRQKSRMPSSA